MTLPFSAIRKQVAVLEIAERFFDSVILLSLSELDVFRALAEGPMDVASLAARVKGHEQVLGGVLDAGVAVGILQRDDEGAYSALEAHTRCLGDDASPEFLGEWLTFLSAMMPALAALPETVRTGRPAGSMVDGSERDNRPAIAMTAAMDAYARTRGIEFVTRLDMAGVGTVLDVGCGPGTYSLELLARHPELHAILLDLPGPIAHATGLVRERGLADRATLHAEDAFQFTPSQPVDLILISNVLHMLGPDRSRALLARALSWVRPGGRIVLQAEYLDSSRTAPRWPALLNLIMQATTEGGRNHTVLETTAWLEEAGWIDATHHRMSPWNVNSYLEATRPREDPTHA